MFPCPLIPTDIKVIMRDFYETLRSAQHFHIKKKQTTKKLDKSNQLNKKDSRTIPNQR